MQRMQELLKKKKHLNGIKRILNKNAPFSTEEGASYARVLVKLTLIELELEEIQGKEKRTLAGIPSK